MLVFDFNFNSETKIGDICMHSESES